MSAASAIIKPRTLLCTVVPRYLPLSWTAVCDFSDTCMPTRLPGGGARGGGARGGGARGGGARGGGARGGGARGGGAVGARGVDIERLKQLITQ